MQAYDLDTELANLANEPGLAAGISSGAPLPILSFSGKQFTVRYGDSTAVVRDVRNRPANEIEVVIVAAAPNLSKTYYETGYDPSTSGPPDCFSLDGKVPDPAATKPQAATCAECPQNVWGSKKAGSSAKACTDRKRLIVVPTSDLLIEQLPGPLLLAVPPKSFASLTRLSHTIRATRRPSWAVAVTISFEAIDYPQLCFTLARGLDAEEIGTLLARISMFAPQISAVFGSEWTPPPVPSGVLSVYSQVRSLTIEPPETLPTAIAAFKTEVAEPEPPRRAAARVAKATTALPRSPARTPTVELESDPPAEDEGEEVPRPMSTARGSVKDRITQLLGDD